MTSRFNYIIAELAIVLLALPSQGFAQQTTEYQVKAACLYNFAKFIEWPTEKLAPGQAINVCIVGDDPFGKYLSEMDGKPAQNTSVRTSRLDDPNEKDLKNCHLVFALKQSVFSQHSQTLKSAHVVSVSDTDAQAIISFTLVNNRVRFAIDTTLARDSGVQLSSQLLKLATIKEE